MTRDQTTPPQPANKKVRMRSEPPMIGLIFAGIFWHSGPGFCVMTHLSIPPRWIFAVIGFGVGAAIGIAMFGLLRKGLAAPAGQPPTA